MARNNKTMYFPKDYIEEDLKAFLIGLEIVQEIKRPEAFSDIEEDEFLNFINEEFKIPSEFSWIESNSFNDWTIELINKAEESKTDEENQKLYNLIDIMIFDKLLRKNNQIIIEKKDCLPVFCRNEKYIVCNNGNLIWVKENDIGIDNFGYLICNEKYTETYLTWLDVKELNEITPENFKLSEKNYLDEELLRFWKWVYKNSNNSELSEALVCFLLEVLVEVDQLDDSLIEAQRFLLDIITEKEIKNNESVELLDSVIADYLETVNKCSLKISCSNPKKIEMNEIVQEIQKEIQFHDKYDDINKLIENIIVVGEKSQDIGYAELAESKLALPCQTDKRKYRECISNFLKNEYNISLDTRDYTITTIDNTGAINVSEITEEEFEALNIKNIDWSNINDKETKKRLLMEPYRYKSKYIQGYGRTCPLCGKVMITEITTMRIKTIVDENKRYDFLCCSSCADLFNYCDNQPKIDFEGLDKINAKIKLEFFIDPHFLSEPYKLEFEPRPLHRKILLIEKNKENTEGRNNV